MSSQPEEQPYSDSHLDSPEYRRRLLRKLNTLIAVLEVACAKVRRSLASPDPDVERLTRIQNNLKETLQVCLRAKNALERSEQGSSQPQVASEPEKTIPMQLPAAANDARPVPAQKGELASVDEQRKFQRLGPIDLREVRACDLDNLCQKLISEL
ncbi:MAG: hypothetical protein EXS08_05270 [Planctomycetes bacterium]|nr:hypothetical protein [Planctomycetota bacterium]